MSKITCPISGEILQRSDLLLGFDLSELHPIFRAKKSLILTADIIHKFQAAQSWREKKLYYLAVLHTMDLVDFQSIAEPAPYIMEHSFFDVCNLASWVNYARYTLRERISFPRYLVTEETKEMKNISMWLSAINDIKQVFLNRDRENDLKLELAHQSQKIEIEFRRAGLIGQAFTKPLARWALELTDTPEGVFQPWLDLLQTPLEEAWCLDVESLKEIQEHLQAELPITNDQAIAVLHQINKLVESASRGYYDLSSGDDPESEEEVFKRVTPKDIFPPKTKIPGFEFVETSLDIPMELPPEPQRKDFDKLFLYLKAKAGWDLLMQELTGKGRKGEYKQF